MLFQGLIYMVPFLWCQQLFLESPCPQISLQWRSFRCLLQQLLLLMGRKRLHHVFRLSCLNLTWAPTCCPLVQSLGEVRADFSVCVQCLFPMFSYFVKFYVLLIRRFRCGAFVEIGCFVCRFNVALWLRSTKFIEVFALSGP